MPIQTLSRNWWMIAVRGLIAILFGFIAVALPESAVRAFIFLFGVYALLDGVFAISAAITRHASGTRLMSLILEGIVGVGMAALTFIAPEMALASLVFVLAAWSIMTGVLTIVSAVRVRRVLSDEIWFGLSGVASVLFGVLIAVYPFEGAIAVARVIGIYAVISGVALAAFSLRLRGHHHAPSQAVGGTTVVPS